MRRVGSHPGVKWEGRAAMIVTLAVTLTVALVSACSNSGGFISPQEQPEPTVPVQITNKVLTTFEMDEAIHTFLAEKPGATPAQACAFLAQNVRFGQTDRNNAYLDGVISEIVNSAALADYTPEQRT